MGGEDGFDSNFELRSTVAVPPAMARSRSSVPAGIAVPTDAPCSPEEGPLSMVFRDSLPMAGVNGWVRRVSNSLPSRVNQISKVKGLAGEEVGDAEGDLPGVAETVGDGEDALGLGAGPNETAPPPAQAAPRSPTVRIRMVRLTRVARRCVIVPPFDRSDSAPEIRHRPQPHLRPTV